MKALKRTTGTLVLLFVVCVAVFLKHPIWVAYHATRGLLSLTGARSKWIQAGHYRLHYTEARPRGHKPGIPLILVHGLGARGEDWSPLIGPLVAQGFHVYAPDLLGFGQSPRPDVPYSISLEEQVLVDFMNAVHQPHADLDGWSMGGWVAAKLALDHPGMVDRLVLDDSAGIFFPISFPRTIFVPTDAASARQLLSLLTSHPVAVPDFVLQADLAKAKGDGWVVQRTFDSMLSGVDFLDTRLADLHQPTLLLWGTEDKLIPLSVGETMHRQIAHSVLVGIPGGGHLTPTEDPQPVLNATIQFLKAQPAIQGGEFLMPNPVPAKRK